MLILSNDFVDGGSMPEKFTCDGENISPSLSWQDVPDGTKSFALLMTDPNAPSGNYIHWAVVNLPAETRTIETGEKIGDELKNSSGNVGYTGPCPPHNPHQYIFQLFALNIEMISKDSIIDLMASIQSYVIDKAQITAVYQRQKTA